MSIFQYSRVVQATDSYKRLPWQQYLTGTNFKYIFGDRIEILHVHTKYTTLRSTFKNAWGPNAPLPLPSGMYMMEKA